MNAISAYPLHWPAGWPRAKSRKRAKFRTGERVYSQNGGSWISKKSLTIAEATQRVMSELRALGARDGSSIISANLELRNDGLPRSGQREPADPGVAVYWQRKGEPQKVMAIDLYDRVADNLAAVAATLSAMRAIERHGGAQILERAFTGFDALPAPAAEPHWSEVLKCRRDASVNEIERAWRAAAKAAHPDAGGSHEAMARVNAAREAALKRTDFMK
jgi:hypothetical protein